MFAKPNRDLKATAAAASLLALLAGAPGAALACGQDSYVGSLCTTAANYCPDGTLAAQGQVLQVSQYQVLYALLGNMYGGTAPNSFALPDLRGRVVVGAGTGPGLTNVVIGKTRGAEGVALTSNQMAVHNHPATFTGTGGGAGGGGTASGNVSLTVTGSTTSAAVTGTVTANVLTTQTTGSTANAPSNTNNTLGKFGGSNTFYPANTANAVSSPTTLSLTAPSTAISGTAAGAVSLPVTGGSGGITGGTVAVGTNATTNLPVPVLDPGLGMTVCIVNIGLYPPRPN